MYTQKRTRAIPCMVYMYNPQIYYKNFVQIPKTRWTMLLIRTLGARIRTSLVCEGSLYQKIVRILYETTIFFVPPKEKMAPPWKWHRFLKQLHGGAILASTFSHWILEQRTDRQSTVNCLSVLHCRVPSPKGSKLWWHEDMGGGLPNARRPCTG